MNNLEHKIGFDAVREQLHALCHYVLGRAEVEKMQFLKDKRPLSLQLDITEEMRRAQEDPQLDIPVLECGDLRESLHRIRVEGLYLDEEELGQLRVLLRCVGQLQEQFHAAAADYPLLARMTQRVLPVASLLQTIERVMDRYGRIRDNATPELASIRRELKSARGSVSHILTSILHQAQAEGMVEHDVSPTLREGRLVIPISPQYKRQLGGIVHDESATGKTVFVEPQQVVEANNHIRELESQERKELIRILRDVSNQLRPREADLVQAHYYLGKVDFLAAKAQWARSYHAIRPHLSGRPLVNWKQARHPLLERSLKKQNKQIVPLDIQLTPENRILLISGPNAGGKSVCLKTVALLQYMLQCGMLVPLQADSQVGLFSKIFIDIGDEQSLEDDLSTYSGHLSNMKQFLRQSDRQTLLLIDEFGGGTEPQIGGAIAEAVLEKLVETGCYGVITTHYTNLKHLAEATPGLINGAMLYDRHQLQALFHLEIGRAGSSFAVEIARKIGLPEDIIKSAVDKVGAEHVDFDKHLQDIARDKHYWEQKRQKIHQQEKQLERQIEHYEAEMASMKAQRKENLRQAKEEAAEVLRQSHALVEKTIRDIKEAQAEKTATKAARQRLAAAEEKTKSVLGGAAKKPVVELVVGGFAQMKGSQTIGEIIEISGNRVVLAMGELKTVVSRDKLEVVSRNQAKKQSALRRPQGNTATDELRRRKSNFSHELDVRGLRGDEALQTVKYFMDDALMVNASRVRILHGTGNGILRELIRQYLRTLPEVAFFGDEQVQLGGAGITVVEME